MDDLILSIQQHAFSIRAADASPYISSSCSQRRLVYLGLSRSQEGQCVDAVDSYSQDGAKVC